MKKHLIISLVLISLFSCRVAKKAWVKETYAEKSIVAKNAITHDSIIKTEIRKIGTSVSKLGTYISNIETSRSLETESENTTVSGTIEAEDGKEKFVTFGNTKITSNGANVSFETTNARYISKEFQAKFQEISSELQLEKSKTESLQIAINSLKSEFSTFKSNIKSKTNTKIKTVKKTGFQFGVWLIAIIAIMIIILVRYFRKSIPFLNKII